ncbi:polymorphic toxin type 44 domain-containing protein [Nocardia macrotermitis]|uniref:Bacterial toxin 44 domain-containing protein n=1 Tax=Nocardia macrotermitis TaxID=2585198 RepID=A0A7K0DAY7_9NOCA|nr:polymorphic toxin type 44 domain-containing protein [Nocardia macrotermitis]MQY22034.1 hypothetical protein [Nocardia macrotermitis]
MNALSSRVTRKVFPAVLTVGIAGTGMIVMAAPAEAGTNGQQISFCSQLPDVSGMRGGYAIATGTNQNGKEVTTGKIGLRGGGNCENLPNWWFKGMVTIKWQDHTGKVRETTRCAVPTVKNSDWIDCDDVPIHDQLVGWLHQEISKNVQSEVFKDIERLYRNGGPDRMQAIADWFRQVKPGGPWDHKAYLAATFGGRAYDLDRSRGTYYFQWNGTKYLLSYDLWSNFHYGYVGRSAGIDAETLRKAHQAPGTGATDPGDVLTVDLGIDFYTKYGPGETPSAIADYLIEHQAQLVKAGVAKPIPN